MWNFIKKLFSKKNEEDINEESGKMDMPFEDFLKLDFVKNTLAKLEKPVVLLNPRKYVKGPALKSKMGGEPNLNHFTTYPTCDECNSPLNFVLQLYKDEFPEFYWPDNKQRFQLFRCPNYKCGESFSENYDLKMFHFYFNETNAPDRTIIKPLVEIAEREPEVNACFFHKELANDYPQFDGEIDEYDFIEATYSNDIVDEFERKYSAKQQSKINGYPSFTQNSFYPTCTCGKEKEFFFQLASEDRAGHGKTNDLNEEKSWSHHGIMIGDVGNIYYYVCKDCGEKSIESYWDCS